MVKRSRLKKTGKKKPSAMDVVMGDYKMEGPNIKIEPPLKDLPSLKDIDKI